MKESKQGDDRSWKTLRRLENSELGVKKEGNDGQRKNASTGCAGPMYLANFGIEPLYLREKPIEGERSIREATRTENLRQFERR
jgi:hypothetical protein